MNSATQWIYYFSDPPTDDDPVALRDLLGGKGAALKEMSRAGLAVPPGFTISTDCCRAYFERQHRWPEKLAEQLRDNLSRLQQDTGRTFGRGRKPLLLSVRSGAAVSMPGMMDTLLNCGLHPGLADDCRCGQNFWAVYRQFIRMFARVAAGLDPAVFDRPRDEPVERSMRESALADLETYERAAGRPIPTEPWECLVECVNAVFESWHNDRAIAYRKRNHIEGLRGTAVNIQAMFPSQVSGIVFTRDPANVKSTKMLVEASYGLGEAIVSGQVDPDCFCVDRDNLSIDAQIGEKRAATLSLGHDAGDPDRTKAALDNEQITHLAQLALQVEAFYGHPVDLEFGYADGRFALLQSRPIRGLHVAEDAERVRVEEIDRLRQIAAGDRRCWVAHNLAKRSDSRHP